MKNNDFNKMCSRYNVSINELNERFNIPLRTLKAWRYGERKPPDYVLFMLEKLILIYHYECLKRGAAVNACAEEKEAHNGDKG